ncbi:ABC transporter ATP-binding protein [Schumannella sp. 10F1B-5-1]|uniref:ABC transporter ATP-binding protein n=1 Tax=Schumannella sp. 10F1B-5-1 TaxID=2590780 RepID=UPI001131F890|nr:ABC transporter ATP-binding protein [Schumannella sp. 10F1B-5-1]TPW73491.1 ABC transporter ATP-binding protein [Schumannella sp. 10F1B-5-1]
MSSPAPRPATPAAAASTASPSPTPPARRSRNPFARASRDDGPRASFRDLLPYLAEHRGVLIVVIVLSLLGAAASLAQPALVSQVIGRVEAGHSLGPLTWLLIALVVVSALLSGAQHYLLQRTGTSVVRSARRQLVRRILHLPITEFDLRRTGDLVSRVGSDTTLLYAVMTQGLVDAVGGAVVFIGAIIGMAVIDPVLLSLTVLVVAISIVAVVLLSSRVRVASREQQERVGDLAASVERAVSAIRTVRAAGATERESDEIVKDADAAYGAGLRVARVSALIVPIAGIAMQASFLVVLGVGGFRVASGAITIASLVAFILFLFLMIMPLGTAFGAITSVNQALGALGRIREVVAIPSESEGDAATSARASSLSVAPVVTGETTALVVDERVNAAIRFDDVVFRYPEAAHRTEREKAIAAAVGSLADGGGRAQPRDRTVLKGVSFAVPKGQRTALVGPSGAGKSTILSLIERFYDADEGRVLFGERDVRTLDRGELRSQLGYVEQDAPVLAGTLRQNLTLAAPDASDEACVAVLREVNLGAVLERNELGLDAPVGEDGVMLSGGERQRLAIARALLAAPPVLLLDEATASLDGVNEQLLREAIDRVAADRTLLVIAHRLSTVVDSDRIIVLDGGRVAGVGTHDELLESTPLYRELARHQLLA